jgi:NADPH-dependent curcumin reductase
LEKWLSVLGMTGMTAYFGLLDIGRPEPGQTVVVSAAAGAVGSIVGQIAKLQGARAVGIAGGPEKCARLTSDYGYDAAIDYKNDDVARALHQACPDGIDVYFDNVGGEILDAALAQLAFRARVVICGAISQYNETGPMRGPANYMSLLVNNASMTGYVVFHYASRYAEAARQLGEWYAAGKLVSREDVVHGLDRFPDALLKLFEGTNDGKLVLAVGD